MKVQRVQLLDQNRVTWLVRGDDYLPIRPIQYYLAYLENIERSPTRFGPMRTTLRHIKPRQDSADIDLSPSLDK